MGKSASVTKSKRRTRSDSKSAETKQANRQGLFSSWKSTLGWGLLSGLLIWLSFPPFGLWPLAWVAAYGWIRIIRQPTLPERRPLSCLYLIGWLHWLSMTYWVTLPHPAAAVGWLFLAAYLAIYVVGFILVGRMLYHRNHVPLVLSVPIAWVAMEILRTYILSGFGLVALSHSQVDFLPAIQIASITGAYGVSFVVMMVAAAVEHFVTHIWSGQRWDWRVPTSAAIVFAAIVAYGCMALRTQPDAEGKARVAIIQGSLDTVFGDNSDQRNKSFGEYSRMTGKATSEHEIDLVLWPESMFYGSKGTFCIIKYDKEMADAITWDNLTLERKANLNEIAAMQLISTYGAKCLFGTLTVHYHQESMDRYNSAAYFDENGILVDVYHKTHPVMFGEYLPLGNIAPWLYKLTPIPNGLTPGTQAKAFAAGGLNVAPTICFENTVPHLVRRQLLALERQGTPAQALVTLTNDGWFWGSSLLDLHLACGIFRAVENRRPTLIAANTGISAHIDECGNVLKAADKRVSRTLIADVEGSRLNAIYTRFGDWFGFGCVLLCVAGKLMSYLSPATRRQSR